MNVTLKNVVKKYDGNDKNIIDGMNVQINSGELVSVVGPSGCGKSTTLYMIAGLEKVTDGQILFGEEDVTQLTADKRDIGLVFQNYALYPHLSVLKNVMFPLTNRKMPQKERYEQAMEVINAVGLGDYVDKYPKELSGGQQQRVAIARAIVKKPKVLLLDEPLSNLDAKLKMTTILEIKKIQRQFKITTIFVTHDQQEAMAISDRMLVLNDGHIKQMGKPNELYRTPKNEFVASFIGSPGINSFEIEIKDKKVVGMDNLINDDIELDNGKYIIGIRPEVFEKNEHGYTVDISNHEILGRDILIYTNKFKILIPNTNDDFYENSKKMTVQVKLSNVHFFDILTKEVIYV